MGGKQIAVVFVRVEDYTQEFVVYYTMRYYYYRHQNISSENVVKYPISKMNETSACSNTE